MVTPTSLNGACCAAAPAASNVEANINATNVFVFTEASLWSWFSCGGCVNLSPPPRYRAVWGRQNGKDRIAQTWHRANKEPLVCALPRFFVGSAKRVLEQRRGQDFGIFCLAEAIIGAALSVTVAQTYR